MSTDFNQQNRIVDFAQSEGGSALDCLADVAECLHALPREGDVEEEVDTGDDVRRRGRPMSGFERWRREQMKLRKP